MRHSKRCTPGPAPSLRQKSCRACTASKTKCDQLRPRCSRCDQKDVACEYIIPLTRGIRTHYTRSPEVEDNVHFDNTPENLVTTAELELLGLATAPAPLPRYHPPAYLFACTCAVIYASTQRLTICTAPGLIYVWILTFHPLISTITGTSQHTKTSVSQRASPRPAVCGITQRYRAARPLSFLAPKPSLLAPPQCAVSTTHWSLLCRRTTGSYGRGLPHMIRLRSSDIVWKHCYAS